MSRLNKGKMWRNRESGMAVEICGAAMNPTTAERIVRFKPPSTKNGMEFWLPQKLFVEVYREAKQ